MKKMWAALILLLFCFPTLAHAVDTSVPDVKFVWVEKPGDFFSPEERQKLSKYPVLIIENLHGPAPYVIQNNAEEAKQILAINPSVKIFPYFSLSKARNPILGGYISGGVFKDNPAADFWAEGFKEGYFLHNSGGQRIVSIGTGSNRGNPAGFYIDNSNPDFRTWALATFHQWFKYAPFAGIAFDEADDIGSNSQDTQALSSITSAQRTAWNTGQKTILQMFKNQFPGKIALYNAGSVNYDSYFDTADMELEESFCYNRPSAAIWDKTHQLTNLNNQIHAASLGKVMLEKVNTVGNLSGTALTDLGRYCYGIFLLGWNPGKSYFKYGLNYSQSSGNDEIGTNALEINLPLGSPVANANVSSETTGNGVYRRIFTNGYVYVNMETGTKVINILSPVILMNDGLAGQSYTTGDVITMPAQSAYFFLKSQPGITVTLTPTPTPISGDYTDAGDLPGDQVNIFDYNYIVTALQTNYGNPYTIFDYNNVVGNFGL